MCIFQSGADLPSPGQVHVISVCGRLVVLHLIAIEFEHNLTRPWGTFNTLIPKSLNSQKPSECLKYVLEAFTEHACGYANPKDQSFTILWPWKSVRTGHCWILCRVFPLKYQTYLSIWSTEVSQRRTMDILHLGVPSTTFLNLKFYLWIINLRYEILIHYDYLTHRLWLITVVN